MANMSYCRFWNTKIDMDDCLNALWDGATLDGDELMACRHMFQNVLEYFEDICVIEEIDWNEFEKWIESISK